MKTVAVIFGLIFLVYLAAWLGSLDMAARIAALLLIAVKAVGLGALVVLCWKVKKQWDRMEEKLDAMVRHELYAKYKAAPTEEEREQARQEYLDRRGVPESFRW